MSRKLTTREKQCRRIARKKAFRKKFREVAIKFAIGFTLVSVAFGFAYGFWLKDTAPFKRFAEWRAEKYDEAQLAMGFKIKDVVLIGREKASVKDIKQALGVKVGEPLFSFSLEESRERLEKIVWVKHASISRRLSGAVMVEVEERTPIALWQSKGQLNLIDAEGVVITSPDVGQYSDLPIISGEKAPEKAYEVFKMLATHKDLFNQVASLSYIGERRWDVRFYNGVVVKLPEVDPEASWNYLAQLQEEKNILDKDILTLDFRLKDRIFVGLKEPLEPVSGSSKKGEAT